MNFTLLDMIKVRYKTLSNLSTKTHPRYFIELQVSIKVSEKITEYWIQYANKYYDYGLIFVGYTGTSKIYFLIKYEIDQ